MAVHNNTGRFGEIAAVEFLQTKGYRIRHVNWKSGKKELDIVAEYKDRLIIVEVKTRTTDVYQYPAHSIDKQKIRQIILATDAYIRIFRITKEIQFDVISITGTPGEFKIDHIEDSFLPPIL